MNGYFGNVPQTERPEREVAEESRTASRSHPSPNAAPARRILPAKWTGLHEARRERIAAHLVGVRNLPRNLRAGRFSLIELP